MPKTLTFLGHVVSARDTWEFFERGTLFRGNLALSFPFLGVRLAFGIEEITNKSDWWVKVHDAEIAARWKAEALEMNWAAFLKYADFTPAMADAVRVPG